jgi:protein-L-isoaspartate(D-aspartate) O-methyltransferase
VIDLNTRRTLSAEESDAVANLRTKALGTALTAVPREAFLPPGPWLVRGDGDIRSLPRRTEDADPRHAYHNYSIAIDDERQLYNGAPGVIAPVVDALAITTDARVLHIGAGLGYYSAILAHITGPRGRVLALEIDEALASRAAANLSSLPWVETRCADGAAPLSEKFDAILVNAGVTHPLKEWLDALVPAGRIALPLTATMAAMGASIGKGVMAMFTQASADCFDARVLGFVAVYSALALRTEDGNARLADALRRSSFPGLKRLRRDIHDESPTCWLHLPDCCLSLD